jgi:NAD(P)-dependent dehydrogenase (short-subunit alcohol dehydrogenase family)
MKEQKTVLITGSSSGIGRATALYFYERGWNVAATMRSPGKAGWLPENGRLIAPPLDVTDTRSIRKAIDATIERFSAIDVLVNNAGYALTGAFEAYTDEQIRKQFETNLFGLMEVTRAVLPHFRERKKGMLINITSGAGRMTFPIYSIYNATKWAAEGFSESLQFELRPFNIRVKIIEPGIIKTDFFSRSMEKGGGTGQSVYAAYVSGAEKKMEGPMNRFGVAPAKVAVTIYRVACSRNWRLRYPARGFATPLLLFRKFLPESLFLWIMRKLFG